MSEVASRTAQRREDLMKKGLAAKEEADLASSDARAKAASCTASRSAAVVSRAQIEVARASLSKWQGRSRARAHQRAMDGPGDRRDQAPGEIVLEDGLLELANVGRMYAIAEVFENDVRRLKVGQKATSRAARWSGRSPGTVERVRQKVRKLDQIGTDPAAHKDARIVEVEVLLDSPQAVAALSNLQVEVVIRP
jgi:HlyD family secretion protein